MSAFIVAYAAPLAAFCYLLGGWCIIYGIKGGCDE